MNLAGVMLFRFIGSLQHSAEAQAALRHRVHGAVFADYLDVGGAHGGDGCRGRAKPGSGPSGT